MPSPASCDVEDVENDGDDDDDEDIGRYEESEDEDEEDADADMVTSERRHFSGFPVLLPKANTKLY
jgi:hypothetical protein